MSLTAVCVLTNFAAISELSAPLTSRDGRRLSDTLNVCLCSSHTCACNITHQKRKEQFLRCFNACVGRIAWSVQRVATGRTVRESNRGGRRDFPRLSRPDLGPTQPPVQWVPGLSRGKERPGRDADPSPPSSAVVMKGQSYTSTPLWAVRPVQNLSACTGVHF